MIEKIGYYIGIVLAIIIFFVLTFTMLDIKWAESTDDLNGVTSIYHDTGEVIYNETTSFGVKTTATVEKSDCLTCLGRFSCQDCKIFTCEGVNCE